MTTTSATNRDALTRLPSYPEDFTEAARRLAGEIVAEVDRADWDEALVNCLSDFLRAHRRVLEGLIAERLAWLASDHPGLAARYMEEGER